MLLSVLGAFSVLLGCDMTNTFCFCCAVAVCERHVFFSSFFVSPRRGKRPEIFFPRNSSGNLFTRAQSQRPGGRLLALLRYLSAFPRNHTAPSSFFIIVLCLLVRVRSSTLFLVFESTSMEVSIYLHRNFHLLPWK